MLSELKFTRFSAIKPPRLSKRFSLAGNTLIKESGGNLTEGIAERLTIPDLTAFAALLPTLTPKQALAYGINGHDRARVVPKDAPPPGGGDPPVIARTRDHFAWPAGAGLLMLDYDPAPDGPPLGMEALRVALATTCPALADTPAIWRPSASSCIYTQDGAELRGVAGQRFYLPVMDARDIPRAGQALFERLWLAGFGRYELSKSGAFLARALIDASVFQPERLDFCGGAECGKGLAQRLPDPVLINPTAPYLDTALILDLTPDERAPLTPSWRENEQLWVKNRCEFGKRGLPNGYRNRWRSCPNPNAPRPAPRWSESIDRLPRVVGWTWILKSRS